MREPFLDVVRLLSAAAIPACVAGTANAAAYVALFSGKEMGAGQIACLGAFFGASAGFLATMAFLLRTGRQPYASIHQKLGPRGAWRSSTSIFVLALVVACAPALFLSR